MVQATCTGPGPPVGLDGSFNSLLDALAEKYKLDISAAVQQAELRCRNEVGYANGDDTNGLVTLSSSHEPDTRLGRPSPGNQDRATGISIPQGSKQNLAWQESCGADVSPINGFATLHAPAPADAEPAALEVQNKDKKVHDSSAVLDPAAATSVIPHSEGQGEPLKGGTNSQKPHHHVRGSTRHSMNAPPVGCIPRFVQSAKFDRLSASLLIANAIFIGVQIEHSFQETMPLAIDIIDYIFCVLFIVELVLRLYGFGCRTFWTNREDRAWNAFDFTIVLLSTADTLISLVDIGGGEGSPLGSISVLRVVRIVRIVRVLRIIRVMKFFRDLRILLAAIFSTIKTASFALLLILVIMYMFAIAITQLAAEEIKSRAAAGNPVEKDSDMDFFFGGIFRTMFSLFMTIAGGIDWKDAALPLFEVGELAIFFFLVYVALMILCVMNVLLGIFCQCALDTAASDKENVIKAQLDDKERFIETLNELFASWDDTGDCKCSLEEFKSHLQDETTQALLRSLEIEGNDALILFELLDGDRSGEVNLDEFVTGCITLRGGAKAIHMEKASSQNRYVEQKILAIEEKLDLLIEKNGAGIP
eukprot:TRINITY_DN80407_c0_g1_i1.p1 TRINITY_DN80407_c0_g1~~TRINITY_DN80407_c0_g1_i1.p1  ORF type:complete len:589 (-),score=116.57 TRINITY_DN80407_c0_g1_i1:63-1829(-)